MRNHLHSCGITICYCIVQLCGALLFASCSTQPPSVAKQDLMSHRSMNLPEMTSPYLDLRGKWSVRRDDGHAQDSSLKTSRVMNVPANWYTEGLDYDGAVWYERRFFLPTISADTLLRLVFEGVDYEADVWLNGKMLGKHIGYFQPFSFVVNESFLPNAENVLRVRVNSPNERPEDWSLRKRLVKGIFGHHDTRPGGAWAIRGQDANTGGIWGNVYLSASQSVALDAIECTSVLNSTYSEASVCIRSTIHAHTRKQVQIRYVAKDAHGIFTQNTPKEHLLQAGLNVVYDTLHIHKPLLWHTFDTGEPHLYTLSTQINTSETAHTPLASRTDKFGIRNIHYEPRTGEWRLNGKRLFLRGTNYIGTQFLSTMSRSDYDRDAALMLEANVNAVRVHAHIARKEWYDACDSLGLLIWQDFPLQWGYADDAEFVQTASRQVHDMIHSAYNHPSIAAWCLHNEPPFDADWMQYKYPRYHPLQNAALNTILTRIARQLDSTRYVHPFSATREHHWEGWYFGHWTDYGKPVKEHLVTEFGAQALPNIATLETIVGAKPTLPADEAAWQKWEYHNFQRHETFDIAKVSMGASVDEFVRNSQEHQRRVTELAAESYRLQRYAPVGAIFQFMFVEAWASMNWGIVDYLRNPKPAYAALKETYQPTFIATTLDSASGRLNFFVINDRWQEFPKARLYYAVERNGRTLGQAHCSVSVAADAKVHATFMHLSEHGTYRLTASLVNENGDTLSRRTKGVEYYPIRTKSP